MKLSARLAIAYLAVVLPATSQAQTPGSSDNPKARTSLYDVKADAREQIQKACLKASRDNQRILVMFGGDWCGWCHKLHALFKTDAEIRKILSEDYQLVMVDTKAPNAEALLKEC